MIDSGSDDGTNANDVDESVDGAELTTDSDVLLDDIDPDYLGDELAKDELGEGEPDNDEPDDLPETTDEDDLSSKAADDPGDEDLSLEDKHVPEIEHASQAIAKSARNSGASQNHIPTRRAFIYGALGGGASLAVGAAAGFDIAKYRRSDSAADNGDPALGDETFGPTDEPDATTRAGAAYHVINDAARGHYADAIALDEQQTNGDQERYASERYYAAFTKTLPSNEFGEVEPAAFEAFSRALTTGKSADFEAIPLDSRATRTLANPQAAFKYVLSGSDSHTTRIRPSHAFRSPQLATEMAEVYWQALLRDIPFSAYGNSDLVEAALTDLNAMSVPPREANDGPLELEGLFRGDTPGDIVGPYVSQFLLQNFSYGPVDVTQRYASPAVEVDYLTDRDSWLAIQRGEAPKASLSFSPEKKFIYNNRLLGEYVHRDVTNQAYIHAAMILLQRGPKTLDPTNPYAGPTNNQGGFVTFGPPFILDLVMRAASLALTGAWYQKWRAHLTLRPEAYAARVQFQLNGDRSYELNSDILNSDVVARLLTKNGTAFLPVAYPEGSPTHPSYPAGHAVIAGACVTILKAMFDETANFSEPVTTTYDGDQVVPYQGELTVGNELNKLAANISFARNAAGVHYRQDGIQGIAGGEQQAIGLLQDESRTVTEAGFSGFNLVKFDGTPITIRDGKVES